MECGAGIQEEGIAVDSINSVAPYWRMNISPLSHLSVQTNGDKKNLRFSFSDVSWFFQWLKSRLNSELDYINAFRS
jgi:hypothetical protein